ARFTRKTSDVLRAAVCVTHTARQARTRAGPGNPPQRNTTGGRRVAVHDGWQGRYYEDFVVGDVYRHPLGRTISEADNTWFTLLTMNTHPAHFDANYAGRTPFGRVLVNSGLTIAMLIGQS